MGTLNAYASLADYKTRIAVRGLSGSVGTDTSDDSAIESLLKYSSRAMDQISGRKFYPLIETRYFDIPSAGSVDPRVLYTPDLLEVISLTNGDGALIAEYTLTPRNTTPAIGIRLNSYASDQWALSPTTGEYDAIAVTGVWGFHNRYNQAWLTVTTANEAMDASETGYDVVSSADLAAGQLIRFDDELGYISAVGTNTITITRGENGSTATTHLTGIPIQIWQVQDDIKNACLEITQNVNGARSGQSSGGRVTVTAAGVVIQPAEIPALVTALLHGYRDIT